MSRLRRECLQRIARPDLYHTQRKRLLGEEYLGVSLIGKERVRVRPASLLEAQSEGEGLTKAARNTISRVTRPSLADLKLAAGTPSPGSKGSSVNVSPLTISGGRSYSVLASLLAPRVSRRSKA